MTKRYEEEPIQGILEQAPKVADSFGGFGGFLIMAWALWMARKRARWVFGLSITLLAVGGGVSAF